MNDIQLIIFDFDGTLSDTRQTIVQTFQATIRQLGLGVVTDDACAATIGLPLKEGFLQLFPGLDEESALRCVDTYRDLFNANKRLFAPNLFPKVRQTLVELHRRGVRMGIASSRSSHSLEEFLEEMQLTGLFGSVLGVDRVAKAKPDPCPVYDTWKALPMEASHTLVVGDMPVDIEMGRRAGAHTCGVTYGNATREELQEAGAEWVIDDFGQLLGIVCPEPTQLSLFPLEEATEQEAPAVDEPLPAYDHTALFARLAQSAFRSKFHLSAADKAYVREKGLSVIRRHAADLVSKRLAPAVIPNDGKQTPMRGHPIFRAQHATGCCCRGCFSKWHGIPAGRALTPEEQWYATSVLMTWIQKEMDR